MQPRFLLLLPAAAVAAALVAGGALLLPASAQPGAATASTPVAGLTLRQVLEKIEAAGYRDITGIERSRKGGFEVEALDRDGRRVELDVDAHSGEVRAIEVKRDRRGPRTERHGSARGGAMAAVVVSAAAGEPGDGWQYFSDAAAHRAVVISPAGDYYLSRGDGLRQVAGAGAPR